MGDLGSNPTPQLGLCKLFINSLNPLSSNFLIWRTAIIPRLTLFSSVVHQLVRQVKKPLLPLRYHMVFKGVRSSGSTFGNRSSFLLKMQFPEALFCPQKFFASEDMATAM